MQLFSAEVIDISKNLYVEVILDIRMSEENSLLSCDILSVSCQGAYRHVLSFLALGNMQNEANKEVYYASFQAT